MKTLPLCLLGNHKPREEAVHHIEYARITTNTIISTSRILDNRIFWKRLKYSNFKVLKK